MTTPSFPPPALSPNALETLDRVPLRDQALVVVEHHRSQSLPPMEHLTPMRERDYGTTRLTFLRYQ